MAHELDITNGQASFVSARVHAWHQLGRVLDDAFTAEEAMTQGLLGDWDVRKVPLAGQENGEAIPVDGLQAIVRSNPVTLDPEALGVVSPRYTIIQNEEHAAFLNDLVDESGAHFETAGALRGGRQDVISMKMPGHIKVGGVDPIDMYLTAVNSHDGSMSFTLFPTPVRVVCANTLGVALAGADNMIRIRHTSGATARVGEARHALELSFDYLDEFQEQANRLINTTLTHGKFMEIIEKEFGGPDGNPTGLRLRKIQELEELFAEASTQEGVRETAWAGFNAITEWEDHFSPRRGEDRDTARALASVFEPAPKNRALDLMMAVS